MGIINWFYELGDLKRIARSGWWSAKVQRPETVAEHSFRAAVIAYVLADAEGEDAEHVSFLALMHDAHEARVLDLHKVSKAYVTVDEGKAEKHQLAKLPPALRRKLSVAPTKSEQTIIKDADVLELALTAREYESLGYAETRTWLRRAGEKLKTKTAKKWFRELSTTSPSNWYQEFRGR